MNSPVPFKKGGKAVILFNMFGITSQEIHTIREVRSGLVILDTDEDPDKCFVFNPKTGACLNDNTWGGARRTLKIK